MASRLAWGKRSVGEGALTVAFVLYTTFSCNNQPFGSLQKCGLHVFNSFSLLYSLLLELSSARNFTSILSRTFVGDS
jgi:hypothetical protein